MKLSKRQDENRKLYDEAKRYALAEAVSILKKFKPAKFDESVECVMRLNVDPRHADQIVRGTVSLPHGIGKKVRVLVIAKGEKIKEAQDAGADFVGSDDMIEKIKGGWLDFDSVVATPDIMGDVAKLGKILGPRGLMPNPKVGTVTFDIAKAVHEIKAGKIEFRTDKQGNVHAIVGKLSFDAIRITENIETFMKTIVSMRPATVKGQYIRNVVISTTMSPGIKIDFAGNVS
ncbi:MAG: 50S ribosomal protein L1 [Candidatus Delongbacteria bacterium]|nr:50S ribosomal protein L1 [Candidatus Delongbacteria bacterium]